MQLLGLNMNMKSRLLALAFATTMGFATLSTTVMMTPAQAAGEVAIIVNNNAITNYDLQHRVAFLKLQQRKGNLNQMARDELINDMLKRIEMKRLNINIDDSEVNSAYEGFAQRNHASRAQLDQMLNQAGVTPEHFKTYIRTQMGWGRVVSARFRSEIGGGMISEQEAVERMKKAGGVKPSAKEYTLQQIIFVVPANRRGAILGKRQAEANAFRGRFKGCDSLREQAKGMLDVTVRNLGRILEQQLPSEWSKSVIATSAGRMTPPHATERGVEMLAVCEIHNVSDDRVARLVYSIQDSKKDTNKQADQLADKYLKELRDKARIQKP